MNKIFKWFVNLLFIIVIVVLAVYFVLRVTNRIEIYNVKTGSMEQKIHVGDYILILRKKDYKVGDVVTYTSDDGFITHRIIKKEGNKVTTKGDANNTEDDIINSSVIVGKVIISGGILNIVINYKYVFTGFLLSLYLFSCYFASEKQDIEKSHDEETTGSEKDDLKEDKNISSDVDDNETEKTVQEEKEKIEKENVEKELENNDTILEKDSKTKKNN